MKKYFKSPTGKAAAFLGGAAAIGLGAEYLKKRNIKKQGKIALGKEYAFREGMRASLDLKAAGHSSKKIRRISKEYIGMDFAGKTRKGYSDKEAGFMMFSKTKPRQLGRSIKGHKTNKYILYDI
jgi:tRNA 2-selenouridine synthase SelU|tara:strand:- start:47 stop:418 length:372 start_codon:yes stop_codon:yes gene_type:complete